MSNTQAMCTSFKGEILTATHNFGVAPTRGASTADTFTGARYLASATVNAGTTAYTLVDEVSGTNYPAGGVVVSNSVAPLTGGTTAYWTPSANLTYSNVSLPVTFDCVLIYNSTQGNKAVSVHTFGSQIITAGTFTLTMPVNAPGTALLNIA